MKKKKNILLKLASKWLDCVSSQYFLIIASAICVLFTMAFCLGAFLHFAFYKSTMYEIVILAYFTFAKIISISGILTFISLLYITWEEEE